MTSRKLAEPAVLAVSLAEARQALRLDDTSEAMNQQLTTWIEGIVEALEKRTGRAFINRPCRLTLDRFDEVLKFGFPPLNDVTAVKYFDEAGAEQTLDPQDYFVDRVSQPGFAVPAPNKAWPCTFRRINSVNVDFIAGYGEAPATIDKRARLYILAKLVELFDPSARPEPDSPQAKFIEDLAKSLKVY